MTAIARYLTRQEEADLVKYVAGTGENYQRFIEWCNGREIAEERRFTSAYFHRWCWKKRPKVVSVRAQNAEEVRKSAVMGKQERIQRYQATIERLETRLHNWGVDHGCEECGCDDLRGLDLMLKIEEQLRKTMESLAKEMGEFNKPEEQNDGGGIGLLPEMAALFSRIKQAPPLIEAVTRDVTPASAPPPAPPRYVDSTVRVVS